jgi:hypothetical protein
MVFKNWLDRRGSFVLLLQPFLPVSLKYLASSLPFYSICDDRERQCDSQSFHTDASEGLPDGRPSSFTATRSQFPGTLPLRPQPNISPATSMG